MADFSLMPSTTHGPPGLIPEHRGRSKLWTLWSVAPASTPLKNKNKNSEPKHLCAYYIFTSSIHFLLSQIVKNPHQGKKRKFWQVPGRSKHIQKALRQYTNAARDIERWELLYGCATVENGYLLTQPGNVRVSMHILVTCLKLFMDKITEYLIL